MLVGRHNVYSVLSHLEKQSELALDTETTGLRPYHGDRPFCFILSCGSDNYVFDLGHWHSWQVSKLHLEQLFAKERYWYLANAKFDMAMLEQHLGVKLKGEIHDLMVYERILDSTLFGAVFALDKIAKRYKQEKSEAVSRYIKENKLTTKVSVPGKKKQIEQPHYDLVPMDIMLPYAEQDARITFDIGKAQLKRVEDSSFSKPLTPALAALKDVPDLDRLAACERQLVRTVYDMEKTGVLVDLPYCKRAAEYEAQRQRRLIEEFESLAGCKYKSSAKVFAPLFAGEKLKLTATGKPCFDAEAMATYKSPYAEIICGIRDAKSKSDYYQGFLYHADPHGVIHPNLAQHIARTGRFGHSSPNTANLTRPDADDLAGEFTPRRAIIPRPGHFFTMLDYDQVEYRLMLDYCGATDLINKILGGLDVHAATAELAGITRPQAKTTNFLTIYGGGDEILAKRLGKTVPEARGIREAIFRAAPEIKTFIRTCVTRAEERGFVYTWLGRRLYYPDTNDCYRAANGIIQGGCADVLKMAMNKVAAMLALRHGYALVLSIHDELVIECAEGSSSTFLEGIKLAMQGVYQPKHLPLTCGMDHSWKSLADKKKGLPA